MVARVWSGRAAQAATRAVLQRDGYTCAWCGGPATTAEHIRHRSKGGDLWDLANMVAACRPCNSSRRDRARPSRTIARPSRDW